MSAKYTDTVGYKFNADGSMKEFKGATVISFVRPHERLYREIVGTCSELAQAAFAHKLSFLPPPSYHMTNFVLYNDHISDREGSGWSDKIPRDRPCAEINAILCRMLEKVPFPHSYRMKLEHIEDGSFQLIPATEETESILQRFRDECAHATGIRGLDHDSYRFHITYAYTIVAFDREEKLLLQEIQRRQTMRIQRILPEFGISGPIYCTFNDMGHFEPCKSFAMTRRTHGPSKN